MDSALAILAGLLLEAEEDLFWGLLAGAATFLTGLVVYLFYFVVVRNKRVVENMPTSKCRSVPMGLVELAGRAAGSVTFPSPIGGIPSFVSRVVIEAFPSDAEKSNWETVYEQEFSTAFYVDDGTGRIRVSPEGAELSLAPDLIYNTQDGLREVPGTRERLAATGLTAEKIAARLRELAPARNTNALEELLPQATRYSKHAMARAREYGDMATRIWAYGRRLARLPAEIKEQHISRRERRRRKRAPERPYRCREENLCPGDAVFVLGTAVEEPGGADEHERIRITWGKHHPWFVIGRGTQQDVLARVTKGLWLVGLTGILVSLLGVAIVMDALGLL